jgi:hypothetical protein
MARGKELDTVESKVYFTLSYMKGGLAEVWAGRELDEIEQHKKDTYQFMYTTFNMFKDKVDKQFSKKDEKAKA